MMTKRYLGSSLRTQALALTLSSSFFSPPSLPAIHLMSQLSLHSSVSSSNSVYGGLGIAQSPASSALLDDPYRTALNLFINKQFSEAVNVLEPILSSSPQIDAAASSVYFSIPTQQSSLPQQKVSHVQFVKLWNLYLAILNIAVEQSSISYRSRDEILDDNATTASFSSSASVARSGGWTTSAHRKKLAALASSGDKLWIKVADSSNKVLVPPQVPTEVNDSETDGINIPIETVIPLVSLISRHTAPKTVAPPPSSSVSTASTASTASLSSRLDASQSLANIKIHLEHYMAALPEKENEIFFGSNSQTAAGTPNQPYTSLEVFYQLQVKLTEVYITKILFPLHEYEYASEFISMAPTLSESKKASLMSGLKMHQQQFAAEIQEMEKVAKEAAQNALAKARTAALEAEEKSKAKKKSSSLSSRSKKSGSSKSVKSEYSDDYEDDSSLDQALSTISAASSSTRRKRAGNGVPDYSKSTRKTQRKKKTSEEKAAARNSSALTPIYATWKRFFAAVSVAKVVSVLALIAFIVSLLRATAARKRAQLALAKLWAKVSQTVRMGTKVSYV